MCAIIVDRFGSPRLIPLLCASVRPQLRVQREHTYTHTQERNHNRSNAQFIRLSTGKVRNAGRVRGIHVNCHGTGHRSCGAWALIGERREVEARSEHSRNMSDLCTTYGVCTRANNVQCAYKKNVQVWTLKSVERTHAPTVQREGSAHNAVLHDSRDSESEWLWLADGPSARPPARPAGSGKWSVTRM